jgi:hypothetical protein
MKTKILLLVLFMQIMCIFTYAQNHRHLAPLTTESVLIDREYGAMYEFKTTTTTDGSRFNTVNIINKRFLYTIPERLKVLYIDEIDSIMRKDHKIEMITWSCFIIWQTIYSKDSVSDKFSFFAVRVALLSFLGMFVGVWLMGYLISKNLMGFQEMIFIMEEKYLWMVISMVPGIFSSVISMFFYDTHVILPFFYIPYSLFIGFILHLLILWYRKYYPNEEKP